jgi:hypothetical protein
VLLDEPYNGLSLMIENFWRQDAHKGIIITDHRKCVAIDYKIILMKDGKAHHLSSRS